MKRLVLLFISILSAVTILANPVTRGESRIVADNYFRQHSYSSTLELNKRNSLAPARPFLLLMLSDQGSNLDSSDPESDVLPVTPSDKLRVQK